jgi:hypothetical protein
MLDKASAGIEAARSFHFTYRNEGGGSPILSGLTLNTAEGDLVKPDRIRVNINANFGSSVVETQFIGIGDTAYVSNPITREWQKAPGAISASAVFDPQTGVTAVLKKLRNPTRAGDEDIDGVPTYKIIGEVDATDLAAYTGGKPISGATLKVELWIAKSDLRIRQVRIPGKIAEEDPPNIVRVIKLSKYDEPATIEPPPGLS